MKKLQIPHRSEKPSANAENNRIAFQGGSYSLIVTAIVLALLIVLNILAAALPTTWTQYDISSTKLYSITSNTKAVVNALEEDVTIYWIVQAGEEDKVIENLLDRYDVLSDHIEVVKKNPDIYPTFAEQYTDETVENNSLVVECGDRSRFIGYDDIYISEADMYSYSYNTSFDGEGAITSAIDYVVNEEDVYKRQVDDPLVLHHAYFGNPVHSAGSDCVLYDIYHSLYCMAAEWLHQRLADVSGGSRNGGRLQPCTGIFENYSSGFGPVPDFYGRVHFHAELERVYFRNDVYQFQ